MQRILSLLLFFTILSISGLSGQEAKEATHRHHVEKGDQILSLGVSFLSNPSDFALDLFTGGTGSGDPTPGINLHYEYSITNNISLGGIVGYYRVNAQQNLSLDDISDLLGDPDCAIQCLVPIAGIGSNCNCDTPIIKERVNVFTIVGKLVYHRQLPIVPEVDFYTSITAGYSFNRRKTIIEQLGDVALDELTSSNVNVPTFIYYISVGGRYFINDNWAIFGEGGFSNVHLVQAGVTYRF